MTRSGINTLLAVSAAVNVLLLSGVVRSGEDDRYTGDINIVEVTDTLTDWDIFTLALMKVESEFDRDAVSSAGAMGYFQMTPVYVKEVNRIHHTDFSFSDVTDFRTAYEIFDLMQKAHNPGYDMRKALELHNGKHEWYNRRVFREMENFRKYEEMRDKIKGL